MRTLYLRPWSLMSLHETRTAWISAPQSPMTDLGCAGQASSVALGSTVAVSRGSTEFYSPACSGRR